MTRATNIIDTIPSVPPKLEPMRLSRRPKPFNHADSIFELKLDGFRALVYLENGQGRLVSRQLAENIRVLDGDL